MIHARRVPCKLSEHLAICELGTVTNFRLVRSQKNVFKIITSRFLENSRGNGSVSHNWRTVEQAFTARKPRKKTECRCCDCYLYRMGSHRRGPGGSRSCQAICVGTICGQSAVAADPRTSP